ncbi:MAG: acyltransferase [Minicystis sp.]
MNRTRSLTVAGAALLPVVLLVFGNGCSSCKKETDDHPATTASAAPPPAPTPSAPATVMPEEPVDAGTDAGDAGTDAGKPGGGSASGSIAKCCAALQQNANSAPLDQKPYYMAAANACNGMRNTPSAQQAFAQLRMFLAGAKMPAACK